MDAATGQIEYFYLVGTVPVTQAGVHTYFLVDAKIREELPARAYC